MKITVVIDNYVPISTPQPFLGEHGLSLLLESPEYKLLMDTGQSDAVVKNLSLLGIHPNQLDGIILSHGHYDHTGGLEHLLACRSKPTPIYAHPGIFKERYSTNGGQKHQIGIRCVKERLTSLGAEWNLSITPFEIQPNLLFGGQIPRTTSYETGDIHLIASKDGCTDCQDDLDDDISLYYTAGDELVVIAGCAHSGMINTIRHGLEVTNAQRLKGWIGGTHLGPVSRQQQSSSMQAIEAFAPQFIGAGHCTGFDMMAQLQQHFKDKFLLCHVGRVIDIG